MLSSLSDQTLYVPEKGIRIKILFKFKIIIALIDICAGSYFVF